MSDEPKKYEYEVGFPKMFSTEYKWTLNDWFQLCDLISNEEIVSDYFDLNGLEINNARSSTYSRIRLSPKTPRQVLTLELFNNYNIKVMKVKISAGDNAWNNDYKAPIPNIFMYKMGDDVPKQIFVPDKNGAVIILVEITIMRESTYSYLLNPSVVSPRLLSTRNPEQNILANFKRMFDHKTFCDVTIVVGDETFHAHKAFLAAQSKVFEAMFSSDMKEQSDNTIEISNFHAKVFEQFLNYLYRGEKIELEEKVEEMIVIADYYNVPDLKIECEQIMLKHLSGNSAVQYVILADKLNCNTLKAKALDLIRKSSTIIEKALLEDDAATLADLKEILSKNKPAA